MKLPEESKGYELNAWRRCNIFLWASMSSRVEMSVKLRKKNVGWAGMRR